MTLTVRAATISFDFGAGPVAEGSVKVLPHDHYDSSRGYGFEPGSDLELVESGGDAFHGDACGSEGPFLFSVDLPEGNYLVNVTFVAGQTPSIVTVKAENRRLMLEGVLVKPGLPVRQEFAVNIRMPHITDDIGVRINERERGSKSWDSKLTLEFNGKHPVVAGLEITSVSEVTTIYIAGDSTVTDQPNEPWAGWGQMLPRFFGPDVVVANYAESGRSLRSFKAERRLEKILSCIKPGDYLFIQFGHNDMKEKGEGIGPYESYSDSLMEYIQAARARRAIPVLITPMHRRWFADDGKITNTFGDYPDAMRQVAAQMDVPLIDLMQMSKLFYDTLGKSGSTAAFVHYPANTFPGQSERLKDNTHHNAYGAYQLARCVVNGIEEKCPELADKIRADVSFLDPANPPDPQSFVWPLSPFPIDAEKPEGD